LLDNQAAINYINAIGQSALHLTISSQKPRLCQFLLNRGIDISIVDSLGMTALDYARELERMEFVGMIEQEARERSARELVVEWRAAEKEERESTSRASSQHEMRLQSYRLCKVANNGNISSLSQT
jgi:hypothetical protein